MRPFEAVTPKHILDSQRARAEHLAREEARRRAFLEDAPKGVEIRVRWSAWPGWAECRPPTSDMPASATIVLDEDGKVVSFIADNGTYADPANVGYHPPFTD